MRIGPGWHAACLLHVNRRTSAGTLHAMLAIREEGRGEPLVLVHGAGTSSAVWRRTMPSLAARRRVIAPDLPGYGCSPAAGPDFALPQRTDHLMAGLEGAGLHGPYDLVGHSM